MTFDPDKARRVLETADLVCSAAAVSAAVERMAREITAMLAESFPVVMCIMRGAVFFAGQLLPQLRFPLELDYLDVRRYGDTTRGGEITWRMSPGATVKGRTVLVLDDILDDGNTLAAVQQKLRDASASRVYYAVLTEKDTGRVKSLRPDFVGLHLPNRYVFGCGMDVGGLWRNLPEIYALNEDPESRIQDSATRGRGRQTTRARPKK